MAEKKSFKIGDNVIIRWPRDKSDGRNATIVGIGEWNSGRMDGSCVCYIPGFMGHSGGMEDGRENYWNVRYTNLELLSPAEIVECSGSFDFLD